MALGYLKMNVTRLTIVSVYNDPMKNLILILLLLLISSFLLVVCSSLDPGLDVAPDFSLDDTSGTTVSLTDLLKINQSVTLVFFRGHF